MLQPQNLFSSLKGFSPTKALNHLKKYAEVGGYSFLRKAPAVTPLAEVKQSDTAELQFKRMIDLDIKSNEGHTELKNRKYSGGTIKSSEVSLNNSEYSPASTAHPTNPMTEEANKAYAAFSGLQKYCAKLRALTGVKSAGLDTQLDYGSNRKDIADEANRKQKIAKVSKKIETLIKKFNDQLPEGITHLLTEDFRSDINGFEEKLFSTLCAVPAYDGKPLTVEKEVGIFLDIGYTKMFEDSNSVFKRALQQKAAAKKDGKEYTMPVIDARSWAGSDADGNVNVTPEKTLSTILSNKKKAAELYNNDFEEFFPPHQHISTQMKEIREALKALSGDMGEAEAGRDGLIAETQSKIKAFLEAEAAKSTDVASPAKVLLEKYEQFKLTGPKADIRQSSVQNNEFLQAIYENVLKDNLPEIKDAKDILKSGSDAHKAVIEALKKPELKAKVKARFEANKDKPEWKELNRMIVAVTNPNSVDRYRISDARNIEDIAALRGLEALAQEISGQEVKPKINFIPLAETEEDIKRLTETLPEMVKRELCLKDKDGNPEITMFVGYSDAEKRMGLTGLTTIVETVGEVDKNLKEVGKEMGVNVKLKLSHGGGEDVMRGARAKQADKTEQGTSGVRIGTGTNFKEALRNNANDGNAIDGLLAAGREIADLKKTEPALAELSGLDTLAGRVRFRSIMSMSDTSESVEARETHESLSQDIPNKEPKKAEVARGTGDLLSILLHPSRLISKLANVSSRAGSKGASGGGALATNKTFDLDSERAIGMGSIFPISGARLQALMGLPTLDEIKSNETASGKKSSDLFAKSVVQQDIVYKGLLEASLTDFDTLYDQYPDVKKKSSAELIQNPVKEDYEAVTKAFKEALGNDDKAAMTVAMQKFVDMMHSATLQTTMGLFYKLGGDIAVAKFKDQFSKEEKTGEMTIARATRKTIKAGFTNFQKSYPSHKEGQEILRDICDKSKLSEPDRAHLAQLIRDNKDAIRTDITEIDPNIRGYMASVVRKLQDVPHSLELLSAKPVSVS